jgi:energy-coupling factor transport system substrate-specific component
MIVGALGGLIVGVLVATGVTGQTIFGFTGTQGATAVWLAVLPFLVLILVASLMLSGREQFVEEVDED